MAKDTAGAKGTKSSPSRSRITDKLQRPGILTEIVKTGLALSGNAQSDFLEVLETVSVALRQLLVDSGTIGTLEISHEKAWPLVKGLRIGFVDGGMANVNALGAAPVAIRVGSYVVIPGRSGPDRESFDFELTLVDELYDTTSTHGGVYDDWFDDPAKLRDAARIVSEMAGVLRLLSKPESPDVVLLHGPPRKPRLPVCSWPTRRLGCLS